MQEATVLATVLATVRKGFTFNAAHDLPYHEGPCRNYHGHTYHLEVFARGPVSTKVGSSSYGMVMDFGKIRDVYCRSLEPFLEHQYLNDSVPWVEVTTAEMLAVWILGTFRKFLPEVFKVRLHETETSYAEVELE